MRLRIPATLTVAVVAGCMDSGGPGSTHLDATVAMDRAVAVDASVVPEDVRQAADLPGEDQAADVPTTVATDAPGNAGTCQNVSFFHNGCVSAVDYPDGAEIVDAYDETCAPDPEPGCA